MTGYTSTPVAAAPMKSMNASGERSVRPIRLRRSSYPVMLRPSSDSAMNLLLGSVHQQRADRRVRLALAQTDDDEMRTKPLQPLGQPLAPAQLRDDVEFDAPGRQPLDEIAQKRRRCHHHGANASHRRFALSGSVPSQGGAAVLGLAIHLLI